MKYCTKCGREIEDNILYCPFCGNSTNSFNNNKSYKENNNVNDFKSSSSYTLRLISFVFLVVICVISGVALFPLIWLIPFTVCVYKSIQDPNYELSTGLKICILIFGGIIPGILLLCDN